MYEERISVNPEVCFGKPAIAGTRIPVYMIIELVEQGMTPRNSSANVTLISPLMTSRPACITLLLF